MKQQISKQKVKVFDQVLHSLHNVDHNLSIERIPQKVLLLMGQSKAGKTTALYYLLKKKLILEKNKEIGIMQMRPETICFNAQIGNQYESATVYPNIPTDVDEDECLLIDMPGFNDSRPLYRFLNIYIIKEVIKNVQSLHATFVLPFQSIQGEALLQALMNTCPLLHKNFLKAEKSFSFMLTKIQDQESDRLKFQEQMQQLKQNCSDEEIDQVLSVFAERNIYIFTNHQPNLVQGGKLKKRIINQNKFYSRQGHIQEFLSEGYADIIIGKGECEQFNQFIKDMIDCLSQSLPIAIELFVSVLKYHHKQIFQHCGNQYQFNFKLFAQQLQQFRRLNLATIEGGQSIREQIKFSTMQEGLKSLSVKIKKAAISLQSSRQKIMWDLSCLVNYSHYLSRQLSGISENLREVLYFTLKNSYQMIETLLTIGERIDIRKEMQNFLTSQRLNQAIRSYFSFIEDPQFLQKMMEMPETTHLLAKDEQFRQIISFYNPKYISSNLKIIEEIVQQKVRNKLKKNSFEHIIVSNTKQHKPTNILQPKLAQLTITTQQQFQNIYDQINQLPLNYLSLPLLFTALKQLKRQRHKWIRYNMYLKWAKLTNSLLKKVISILSSLSMIEEAVTFSLSIPDYGEIQHLIEIGINFKQLSPLYIKSILLPYFWQIQPDFALIQKLYSYLILTEDSITKVIDTQKEYVKFLLNARQRMNKKNGLSQYETKKFNFEVIDGLLIGQALNNLLQQAKTRCNRIRTSTISSKQLQKKLSQLTFV